MQLELLMRRIVLIFFAIFCAVPSFAVIPNLVGTRYATGSGTTGTCNFSSPFGANGGTDIVFMFRQSVTGGWASPGVTGTTSIWQYLSNNGAANQLNIAIRRHAQSAGTTAIAVAASSSSTFAGNCLEYINVQDVDQISAASHATIADGANIVFPSITTSCTNTIVIGYAGIKPTVSASVLSVLDATWTAEGYTTGGSQSEIQQDKTFAAAGTYQPSNVSASHGGEYVSQTISLLTTSSVCSGWPVAYRVPSGTPVTAQAGLYANQGYALTTPGGPVLWTACYSAGCPGGVNTQFFLAHSTTSNTDGFPSGSLSVHDTSSGTPSDNSFCGTGVVHQLNGIYWRASDGHIFVGGNDFPSFDSNCIFEYTDYTTSSLVGAHTVEAFGTEGAEWVPQLSIFLVFYVNTCRVSIYNSSWTFIGDVGMPVEVADCGNAWQSFSQDGTTLNFYANPHNNNADHNTYVYHLTGLVSDSTISFRYLGKYAQYFESGTGLGYGQQVRFFGNRMYYVNRTATDSPPSYFPLPSLTQSNWWAQ